MTGIGRCSFRLDRVFLFLDMGLLIQGHRNCRLFYIHSLRHTHVRIHVDRFKYVDMTSFDILKQFSKSHRWGKSIIAATQDRLDFRNLWKNKSVLNNKMRSKHSHSFVLVRCEMTNLCAPMKGDSRTNTHTHTRIVYRFEMIRPNAICDLLSMQMANKNRL